MQVVGTSPPMRESRINKNMMHGSPFSCKRTLSEFVKNQCQNHKNFVTIWRMSHIQAIYENGVLRPLTPLDLEENTVVEIDVRDGNGHIESSGKAEHQQLIESELTMLDTDEIKHLEEEFKDYEQLHPRR